MARTASERDRWTVRRPWNDRSLGSTRPATSRLVPCHHARSFPEVHAVHLCRDRRPCSYRPARPLGAQELGGAGTVQGTVLDPTGGAMVAVTVTISSPVSGFRREATTDAAGRFVFRNLLPNGYHLAVSAQGFQAFEQDVDVRSPVPIELTLSLALAPAATTVDVVGHAADLIRAGSDGPRGHRSDRVARLPVESAIRPESGDHASGARRRRRRQRLLSPDWRPCPDAVRDRQPAGHRSAEPPVLEPDLTGRRAVDGGDHRRGTCGVSATRPASWCTSPPSRVSISRGRPGRSA